MLKSTFFLSTLWNFIFQVGVTPKVIRTEFDPKLISGKVQSFLTKKGIKVKVAPPKLQDQNELVEQHQQTIVTMTCNWMCAALLPSKYWWFLVRRACELHKIMPMTHIKNKISTPFEMVHSKQVDYRLFFLLLSIAYTKYVHEHGTVYW